MTLAPMHRRVWRVGDRVDGDTGILPLRFTAERSLDRAELRAHLFSTIRPDLKGRVSEGDVVLAGEDFACGRLHAQPIMALRESGVVVVARTVPYLAYRRLVDAGVHLLLYDEAGEAISDGDTVELSDDETILTAASGGQLTLRPLPRALRSLVAEGGFESALARAFPDRDTRERIDPNGGTPV